MSVNKVLVLGAMMLAGPCLSMEQQVRIGIIDFYGLGKMKVGDARNALTVKEGAIVQPGVPPAFVEESKRRLSELPGVRGASIDLVCCDEGRVILYVGIEEQGRPVMHFREAPRLDVVLTPEVLAAGREFEKAMWAAVQQGAAAEDDSEGHSLAKEGSALRAVQESFIGLAKQNQANLSDVLRNASDASQRALAAQVLGYAPDKQSVVTDLVYAMSDPDGGVRNNAMRALAVIARMTPRPGQSIVLVPYEPFVELLRSPIWSDRNKSSFALMQLTEARNPELLALLRKVSMPELTEMARWSSKGHATPALAILGRLGGMSDVDVFSALDRNDRETIIRSAMDSL
jgi:hypothetical protein